MSSTSSPSIKYNQYLDCLCGLVSDSSVKEDGANDHESSESIPLHITSENSLNIGIIGGGMAGLYSALLLQKYIPGVKVKIFEANNRVGGRVYTHKFSSEPYQYFEAGAMRLPYTESHMPVFNLIDYLNKEIPNNSIELMAFNTCPTGNRVLFSGTKQKDGHVMSAEYANKHGSELGFPVEAGIVDGDNSVTLMNEALSPVIEALEKDFEAALKKYSDMSVYNYLSMEMGWNSHKINSVEIMGGDSHSFQYGVIDLIFNVGVYYRELSWKSISGGMSKLPELCAEVIEMKGGEILLNASVESIVHPEDKSLVRVGYIDPKHPTSQSLLYETFDAVIMTLPPPNIHMIPERPCWGADVEHALRITPICPASKLCLRFNTRFWERLDLQHPPSHGGQSVTNLPFSKVLYPHYGIGDTGKGVLIFYNISNDSTILSLKSKKQRISLALRNLQLLYPEVSIAEEYAGGLDPEDDKFLDESFLNDWSVLGILYRPGQFLSLFPVLAKPQSQVYFAGSHLSFNRSWIVGALESAKRAVQQIMKNSLNQLVVDYL